MINQCFFFFWSTLLAICCQYVCKNKTQRLDFLRDKQNKFRTELYEGIIDSVKFEITQIVVLKPK